MPCDREMVVSLSHYMKGITRREIPIASSFVFIICHALVGDSNGESISGCTRERGAVETRVNLTLSGLRVDLGNLGVPSGIRDNTTSASSSCGTSLSLSSIHSGIISTDYCSCLIRMSLAEARTFL